MYPTHQVAVKGSIFLARVNWLLGHFSDRYIYIAFEIVTSSLVIKSLQIYCLQANAVLLFPRKLYIIYHIVTEHLHTV